MRRLPGARQNGRSLGAPGAAVIVMKFGGTSVEDATAIDRVASIVKGASAGAAVCRG